MIKADLHLHSKFSNHPSEWFLQRLGTAESYTEPEFAFQTAVERGMNIMTLTDHNTMEGSLLLKKMYPDRVITGVESTAYFPEDGCKVHFLIYGLSPEEFVQIEKLRTDIYRLRDYVRDRKLAHSVAHATYAVNGMITKEHLEKLILLFDVFEGINGGRSRRGNLDWFRFLRELTPADLDRMYRKHHIEPFSTDPWIKGITGGSDDHAGLFIGRTYTIAHAKDPDTLLECLRNKETYAEGRHNDYQGLTFMIYKIAADFARKKSKTMEDSPIGQFANYIFSNDKFNLVDKLKIKKLKAGKTSFQKQMGEFLENIKSITDTSGPAEMIDRKLDVAYDQISRFADHFLSDLFRSVEKDLKNGDLTKLFRSISSSLLGIFISVPFVTTFRHLFQTRGLIPSLRKEHDKIERHTKKKILWFTDTLTDMNGVSMTLKTVGRIAHENKKGIRIIASLLPEERSGEVPPDTIILDSIYDFELPGYPKLRLKVPSLLSALKEIYLYDPDEIFVSSPGPQGLLGLFASKLLNIRCSVIYHTDFGVQARDILKEESLVQMIDGYMEWFHHQCGRILVPTEEYMGILESRGWDRSRMEIFRRGIDAEMFKPNHVNGISEPGFTLMYAGRISADKNLEFLFDLYSDLSRNVPGLRLNVVGDGPDLANYRERYRDLLGLCFLGEIKYRDLPAHYASADLFVFPSITDTFGMVVLEAQACGLPCLVSDTGGPKEIIENGKTGYELSVSEPGPWKEKIIEMIRLKENVPYEYERIRLAARKRVKQQFNWEAVMNGWLEEKWPERDYPVLEEWTGD